MAELSFTDTHVHFSDLSEPALRYDWLLPEAPVDPLTGPDAAIRAQRYWADDFLAETRFHNVGAVVHVQAAIGTPDPVEETRWLQAFTDRLGVPQGVIAAVDLTRPDAADTVARHAELPAFRGVRDLRYDDYLTNPRWRRGYAALEGRGLVVCDDPALDEMELARDLVARHPGVTYCVDHAGLPRQRDPEYFERWRTGMRALAAEESTVVKISGLGMGDHRWTVESLRPWVLECIDAFGVDRSCFGTNWPLDRLYSSYGDVVDAYAEIIRDFSDEEQRAVFSGTANRVFRVGPAGDTEV
jgi:predicted TIM-barrel fold metal-dependent hydrolase